MSQEGYPIEPASLLQAVEQAADGIVFTDTQGTIQFVNPAFTAMTGYSSDEALFQNPRILKSGCHPEEFYEGLWETIRSGQTWSGEVVNRRKDGSLYTEEMRIAPVRNSNGVTTGYIAIKHDVTEKRASEEKDAFLAAIVENSEDAIIACSPSGVILAFNRSAEKILGYSAEDVLGRQVSMLVPPERVIALEDTIRMLLEGISVSQYEGLCLSKDGRRIPVSGTGSLIKNSAGEVIAISNILRNISERREAERDRALLASIVESSEDAIFAADLDGSIVSWNPGAERMLGYTSREIIGSNVTCLATPERLSYAREIDQAMRDGNTVPSFDAEILAKDGRDIPASFSISAIRNSAGQVLGSCVSVRNISSRVKAERELRQSEERFRKVFEQAPIGICVGHLNGHFIQVNAAFCAMIGYSERELLAKTWMDLTDPDALPLAIGLTERLQQSPLGAVEEKTRYVHRDGHTIWVRLNISLIREDNGEPFCFVGHVEDTTERKQAEEALRESEKRFRTFADGCPSMLWVTGPMGKIQFINRALREFCGATSEDVEAGNWQMPLHPDDAPECFAAFELAIRDRAPFSAESRLRRADGEFRMLGTRAEPRLSTRGEYMGHIGLSADITQRKQGEQARQFQHSLIRTIHDVSLDGILVVNDHGKVVTSNQKFFDVWHIHSEEVPADPVDITKVVAAADPLVSACLARVKDPDAFLMRERALHADRDASDQCEIELKDDRTLERHSTSLRNEEGEYLARAWFFRDITERKQAEKVLTESENRFRIMADSCPIGIWVTGVQGEMLFVNRAYRRFCGITSEEVAPDAWKFLLHQDDAPDFFAAMNHAVKEHTAFTTERRHLRADGEWRWVESYAEPRFSLDGEFLGFVGTSKDTTDRKRAEQALQTIQERFRQLTENIREVFWIKTFGSDSFLYVSPAYEQVWGRTCATIYHDPESRLEAIHPDDLERSLTLFARQMQGEDVEAEYRIRTPEKEEKWIRDRAFPVRDSAGQLIRLVGILEDITERKRHEEDLIRAQAEAEAANRGLSAQHAILENERKILRAFIENVPDRMFVKDLESRFVVANPEVALRLGVEKPEYLLGKTDFDFFPYETATIFYEDEQQVIRAGKPMFDREEKSRVGDADEVRYTLTTKVPLFDGEGHVTGIAGIGRDITARKRMEDALREGNRQLQQTTERANQLALKAEEANRAKSKFLANMSHEIRTPMNGVLGMTGLLLSSNLDAEQRHYAEVVNASAQSLLTVIDDILDYSKVEAGKLEIDTLDFNLLVLMDDLAELMAERIGEKQLEFICAVAPDISPHLKGDPGRLRQVLINLVSNAMKFTDQGEVAVRADLITETDAEVSLRFSVRDTGIGIPEDKQGMLFNSFTQVDASTTRKYGGTGLGLAISKKLVELMGGKIGLESKQGEGSEFWFTVRFAKQLANNDVDYAKVPMRGTRILVVDDSATNREAITAQLQSWGAVVAAVESGSEAMACLHDALKAGSRFQLAVLDVMMPEMDGVTLGRAILADENLKAMPLVMMTFLGQRGDAHRFKSLGFAACLIKPVRQSDLFDCLVTVLTGQQQTETRALITRHSIEVVRRSNARILLVEDNRTNQEVATGMLRRLGWHADVAPDGKKALQALEMQPYDLVLMDVQMPEMDGYEATRWIRDAHSSVLNHNIPIIATTAHAMQGDAEKCLEAGMSDFISKTIDRKILARVVEKWLSRKVHVAPLSAPIEADMAAGTAADLAADVPPPKPQIEAMVFDREDFLERMMGDEEFAHDIVVGFLEELPMLPGALIEHAAQQDTEGVCKQAHKIKGAAANVGAEALRSVAMEVEQAAKAGDMTRVTILLPELKIQIARLQEVLVNWANTQLI